MFKIHEVVEGFRVRVNEKSNRNKTIFKLYEHKINSKQLNN
jgi:hypothetical protein